MLILLGILTWLLGATVGAFIVGRCIAYGSGPANVTVRQSEAAPPAVEASGADVVELKVAA